MPTPLFDSATITRYALNGEQSFAVDRPCIIDRIALDITAGTSDYTLPSYLIDIKRITYKGWKIYPLPHRELRGSYQSGTQQGRPYWYIFNNIGQSKIKLFPVPSESITSITTGLYGPEILNRFIVEFYRLPDVPSKFTIPDYFRARLLKCYVNKSCFKMEGKGQNLKAAKYWQDKYEMLKEIYSTLLDDLNNKPRNLIASGNSQRPYGFVPPPPMLPINRFGYSVDEGW